MKKQVSINAELKQYFCVTGEEEGGGGGGLRPETREPLPLCNVV